MEHLNQILLEFFTDDDDLEENDDADLLREILFKEREDRTSIEDYVEKTVSKYSEKEFKMHFRISKGLAESLSSLFEKSEFYTKLDVIQACSPWRHMLVFLWFAGHEAASFRDIADRFNTCIATVHRIIKRVTYFLSSLSPKVIRKPTKEEKTASKAYYAQKGFPGAIGSLDATHIVIDPPDQKDCYIDRNKNCTIILQGACNEHKKFTDVFIGFPGSVHDARVFRVSPLSSDLQLICEEDEYVLCDTAYPCRKHTIPPFKDNGHLTAGQKKFNLALSSARVNIEHTFGIFKQRFRQMYYCKLRGMAYLCHFIRALCVLHNLADINDAEELGFVLTEEPDDNNDDDPDPDPEGKGECTTGISRRRKLVDEIYRDRNLPSTSTKNSNNAAKRRR